MIKKIFLVLIILNISTLAFCGEEDIYLTLDQVSDIALRNNFDIQLARFDAQYEEADLGRALAIYDAVVEAEAKYTDDKRKAGSALAGTELDTREYNFGISKKFTKGTTLEVDFDNERSWSDSPYATINPAYDSSLKLSVTQELGKNLFGIQDSSDVEITKIDIKNAQYTSLDKIEEMLSEIHKTYWGIARHLRVVKIRTDLLKEAERLFEVNKEKLQRGIIEKPQLLASEANLRQREIDLILARNEVEFYKNKLKLQLNLEEKDRSILPIEEINVPGRSPKLEEVLKTAFASRRDYIKAKNEIESKKIKLVMKENNLWPEINLEGSIARNGLDDQFSSALEEIFSEENPEYFIGLKIKLPIENRKAKSEFNKTEIEKAKAVVNLKKIEREIFIEVKDALRDCAVLEERAIKQENVIKLQQEKLRAELARFEYGRSDTDTVIRYQDDLLSSQLLYTEALLEYKEALIELSLKENSLLDRHWKDES